MHPLPEQAADQQVALPPDTLLTASGDDRDIDAMAEVTDSIIHDQARITNWQHVLALCESHPQCAAYTCPEHSLTALHHACSRRCPLPAVFAALLRAYPQALLQADVDKGWTPLHYAARFKAPKEAVYLLLHAYPHLGVQAARKKCKAMGRTPLYYALRYDAPDGVVELLLQCTTGLHDVLEEDKDGTSILGLVWDRWAVQSFEGKRLLGPIIVAFETLCRQHNSPGRAETARLSTITIDMLPPKLKDRWDKANLILKGAFRFPLKDESGSTRVKGSDTSNNKSNIHDDTTVATAHSDSPMYPFPLDLGKGIVARMDATTTYTKTLDVHKYKRTWRILHATAAINCHPTLFMMACVLHPLQALELDDNDLYGYEEAHLLQPMLCQDDAATMTTLSRSDRERNVQTSANTWQQQQQRRPKRTALHFAAKATTRGHDACIVLSALLSLYPSAASIANPVDNALPLHYLCANESKRYWIQDGLQIVFEAYPDAAMAQNAMGQTPLHLACSTSATNTTITSPSPIDRLLITHSQAASVPDSTGRLPLHCIAEFGESWSTDAEAILQAYPRALYVRTIGPIYKRRLPIHMAAWNSDAKRSLIESLLQHHPRSASEVDDEGKLPLHLACEAGKSFLDGGIDALIAAYPKGVSTRQDQSGCLPLHFAAASPNAPLSLIENLVEVFPEAALEVDG